MFERATSGARLSLEELRDKYELAVEVLPKLKPTWGYSKREVGALLFLMQLFNSLCDHNGEKFEKKTMEVFRLLYPHREYIDGKLMLIEATGDEDDPVAETYHRLSMYKLRMLIENEEGCDD